MAMESISISNLESQSNGENTAELKETFFTRFSTTIKKNCKILLLIVTVLLMLILVVFLVYAMWKFQSASDDLTNHPNFAKFENQHLKTVNYLDDFLNFETPYLVSIWRIIKTLNQDQHSCIGALIADDLILAPAHCLLESIYSKISKISFSGNFNDSSNGEILRKYFELIVHEDYNNNDKAFDIGMIKLSQSLIISKKLYPVYLPFNNLEIPLRLSIIRLEDHNVESSKIKKIDVDVINSTECNNIYKEYDDRMKIHHKNIPTYKGNVQYTICVNDSESLFGDSGSPGLLTTGNRVIVYSILIYGGNKNINTLPDEHLILKNNLKWILDNAATS